MPPTFSHRQPNAGYKKPPAPRLGLPGALGASGVTSMEGLEPPTLRTGI